MNSVFYDLEVYPDRFLMGWLGCDGVTQYDGVRAVRTKLERCFGSGLKLIGFNNRRYDHPILEHVLRGADERGAYELSRNIIAGSNSISWNTDIIDLYEICPKIARASLKEFGHRMGYPILETLPYPYDEVLDANQWENVKEYNKHDLFITRMLWLRLKGEYEGRQRLKVFFDIKTEFGGVPRLAEKAIISKLDDCTIDRSGKLHKSNNLVLPECFNNMYEEAFAFPVARYLAGEKPDFMNEKHNVKGCNVKFGVGGLHGDSTPGLYYDAYDYDVASYYPSIILNSKLGGERFRSLYKKIYDDRLALKRAGSKDADVLKLVLNSLYGKLADKYASKQIYAPNLALTICFLGQFYLVDLLCKLGEGQPIIANTDGVVCRTEIDQGVIDEWEKRTKFKLNKTKYRVIIVKDVNGYYAVREDGKIKRKKEFLETSWGHNVKAPIIQRAVVDNLLNDIPIGDTIRDKDVTPYDYCFFSKARRGNSLLLDGEELSSPKIRYYVSTQGHVLERQSPKIRARIVKLSKVKLLMEIKPIDDINYDWYIEQANRLKGRIIKSDCKK